jgi:hypothetical protein
LAPPGALLNQYIGAGISSDFYNRSGFLAIPALLSFQLSGRLTVLKLSFRSSYSIRQLFRSLKIKEMKKGEAH